MPNPAKKPIPKKLSPEDPDSWLRKLHTPDAIKKWMFTEVDFISDYMVNVCSAAATGPKSTANQVKRLGEILELIPENIERNTYYDEVGKRWPAFKKNYKLHKREDAVKLPSLEKLNRDDKAAFFDYGFFVENGAYYTMSQNGKRCICQFTMEILYFVVSESVPKYVCVFKSSFGRSRIAAVTTDDFTTVGTFKKIVGRMNLVFEGNDNDLNKIKLKLFNGVREAKEPKYMGYNPYGDFYTWANGLYYNGQFYKTDKYGMVQLQHPIKSIDDFKNLPPESHVMFGNDLHVLENPERFIEKNGEEKVSLWIEQEQAKHLSFYFLPFSTSLKITDHDDDDFEFERRFKYSTPVPRSEKKKKPKRVIDFQFWSSLMQRVYGANGRVAIAYFIMSLFRDIVYKHNNNYIPLLGMFGPRQGGKSKCAESLAVMFGEPIEDGVNLESGSTATGIRRYLASMQNAILWLNEYKNSLPDYTLGMIKGIADGSGKLTGRNTGGNETKTYKPRCAAIVAGQDLPTKDPAIYSRVIPLEFENSLKVNPLSYNLLKSLEKLKIGPSISCEVLNHRERMKKAYAILEPYMTRRIRKASETLIGQKIEDRLALNLSSVLTTFVIIAAPQITGEYETIEDELEALCMASEKTYEVKFGFNLQTLAKDLMKKVKNQIDVQHTTDDVEQYFNVLQSLIEIGRVQEGAHYKITKGTDIKRLYIRVGIIHVEYMSAAQRAGMAAMDQGTLRSYLKKHRTFLEEKKDGVHFDKLSNRTSAFVFDYDALLQQGIEFKVGQAFTDMVTNDGSNNMFTGGQ